MVVLDEVRVHPGRLAESPFVVAFEEEAARVREDGRLDHDHARQVGRHGAHQRPSPATSRR